MVHGGLRWGRNIHISSNNDSILRRNKMCSCISYNGHNEENRNTCPVVQERKKKSTILYAVNSLSQQRRELERGLGSEEHWLLLQRTPVPFPASTWKLRTICNSIFRESRPSSDLHGHQRMHRHSGMQNTCTHKRGKNHMEIPSDSQNFSF